MQKLAELNAEISKSIALNITFNASIDNFRYNNKWVTDILPSYFSKRIKKIGKLLDKNIDFDKKNHVEFVKVLHQEIIKAYKEQTILDYEDFSSFDNQKIGWDVELNFPNVAPNKEAINLETPSPSNEFDDRAEYIIEIIKGFFDMDSGEEDSELDLNEILIKNYNIDESELDSIYAKAQLSYVIYLHIEMIKEIAYKIDNLLSVVQKLEGFSGSNEHTINEIEDSNLEKNNLSLKFDLSKTNLGHLFYNLYEIGIISKDKADVRDERTKLKNYLNSANLFYLEKNSAYSPVIKMTRAMPVQRNTDKKEVKKEIVFLNDLVDKLNERVETLTEIEHNLKKRSY